ncbi:MAG: hypothetical protein J6B19_05000 [Lachnospiraceae bacterium]|nr:hypothetical protein [Lachnospiraceae bacterium]
MTKTVSYLPKAKRAGDGESPVRVTDSQISLLSCRSKHGNGDFLIYKMMSPVQEVGSDGFRSVIADTYET